MTHQPGVYVPLRALFSSMESIVKVKIAGFKLQQEPKGQNCPMSELIIGYRN